MSSFIAQGVEKGLASVAMDIVEWPFGMYHDISQGINIPPLLALGVSYYVFGMPSMDLGGAELAKQYLATGVAFAVASALQAKIDKSPKVPPPQ